MSDTPMTAAELAGIEARIKAGTMTDEGGEEYIDAEPADIDALIRQVKLQAENQPPFGLQYAASIMNGTCKHQVDPYRNVNSQGVCDAHQFIRGSTAQYQVRVCSNCTWRTPCEPNPISATKYYDQMVQIIEEERAQL